MKLAVESEQATAQTVRELGVNEHTLHTWIGQYHRTVRQEMEVNDAHLYEGWYAMPYYTGMVLAYVFGRRKDDVFLQLQELLVRFGITKFYIDGWGPTSGISMPSNIRWARKTRGRSRATPQTPPTPCLPQCAL